MRVLIDLRINIADVYIPQHVVKPRATIRASKNVAAERYVQGGA